MADPTNEYIDMLRQRADAFDFDKEQQKYEDRLQKFVAPPKKYGIFDLATALSQGLGAQQQGPGPDMIGAGLAMGFNQASAEMKSNQQAYDQQKMEIGLQAAKIALQNEQQANEYLDKTLYELAKDSVGGGGDTADISNFKFRQGLDEEGAKLWDTMKNQDPLSLYLLEQAKRKGGAPGGVDLTTLEEEVDKNFGKIASEYILKGAPQIAANLSNLKEKIEILEAGELNVSGPITGLLGDAAKGIFMPEAASFLSDIRDVIFQSLKEKLGAQFTEREGDRLVAAAFNPYLDESLNVARLQRLYATIEEAARAKQNAITYFKEKGTIKGYDIPVLDFDTLLDAVSKESDFENMTDEQIELYYENADPLEQEKILNFLRKRGQ